MVPTIDQYISASIRALGEVVLPAIDRSDSMALEQAQLVIGLLALIGEQWDKALHVEMAELRAHVALGNALAAVADGGPATQAARAASRQSSGDAAGLAARELPSRAELNAANVALRGSITALVAAGRTDGTAPFRAQADALVLAYSQRQNLLARAWFAKSRLDADWSRLPAVADLLRGEAQAGAG